MTPQELADAKDLDTHATPGPWYVHFTDDDYAMNATFVSTEPPAEHEDPGRGLGEGFPEQVPSGTVVAITLLQHPGLAVVRDERWDGNARFIAAARTYLPRLVAEVERLQAALAAVQAAAEPHS
jgi:hypothetical protein